MSSRSFDLYTQYLIDRFVPVTLFLSPDLDVLYTHGEIDRYFRLPRALIKFNIAKMLAGEALMIFRNGVSKALDQETAVNYRNTKLGPTQDPIRVQLSFQQLNLPEVKDRVVLVEIRPALEEKAETGSNQSKERPGISSESVQYLESQLRASKLETQRLVSEQEATNEELQASNRELMASNEELQSTNEELQSVNEELYTVNGELQQKNEALTTANNDISNLLKSTEIGTIFLDKNLRIRRFTPAVRKLFKLLDSDIGRPISDFSNTLQSVSIEEISKTVYDKLAKFEQEVKDTEGNHYLLRILPYRTEDDLIQGLVITFIDVNELIEVREEMLMLANKFNAIFKYAEETILTLDERGTIELASKGIGPWEADQLVEKQLQELVSEKQKEDLEQRLKSLRGSVEAVSIQLSIEADQNPVLHYTGLLIPLFPSKSITPNEEEVSASIIAVLRDSSESHQRQVELEQNLETYRAFMNNARHQIALVDREGMINYINYTQHTGRSKSEMIGTCMYDYLPETQKNKVKKSVDNIFAGNAFDKLAFEFEYQDGQKGLVELVASPVIIEESIKYVALIGYQE